MRGHWISQTRRLNKHYQSAGGGITPPPIPDDKILTWQRFVTSNSFCPVGFEHIEDTSQLSQYAPNTFYNGFIRHADYVTSDIYRYLSVNDFAMCNKLIGPYNNRSHYFIPGPNYGSISYTDREWLDDQEAQALNHLVSTFDPDYTSSTYKGRVYMDFGIRYTKYIVPKYMGSPYYDIGQTEYGTTKGQVSFPTECKISLSAQACKAYAEQVYSSVSANPQSIVLYTDVPSYAQKTRTVTLGNNKQTNPYDFEQIGQSYYEATMLRIPIDREASDVKSFKMRMFVFFYDGCLYIDHKPHFFDIDTGEEVVLDHMMLYSLKYPFPAAGFCEMDPFYQPSDLYYPSYPSYSGLAFGLGGMLNMTGYYDNDGKARRFFTHYEKDYFDPADSLHLRTNHAMYMQLVQLDVSENEFWATERAWHAIHGGTPYQPLTPTI